MASDLALLELPVPIGDVVDGKYRVERMIGVGGMGCVVEATHLGLAQRVALKFLLASTTDDDAATRLVREARAAVSLASDHVARVLDVGTLPNGMPYLVMEYLEGSTLAQRLARGALPAEEARSVAIQTCRALLEAHRRGIVHRDVKPGNIFLANVENGGPYRVKVLDFGIAKVADPRIAVEPGLTSSEHALGTPRYMAPEQLSAARDVDARADVWAMGVVLFECVTGTPPFARGTAYEVGAQILSTLAPRASSRCVGLPDDLDAIIARCLERDPALRFADASELLAALEGRAPFPSTQVGLGPVPSVRETAPFVQLPSTRKQALVAPAPAVAPAIVAHAPTAERRRPVAAMVGAASAAVVVIAASFIVVNMRPRATPERAEPTAEPTTTATIATATTSTPVVEPPPVVLSAPIDPTPSAVPVQAKRRSPAAKQPLTKPPNER